MTYLMHCSFNHKTGAEDVHFSSVPWHQESDHIDDNDHHEDESSTERSDLNREVTAPPVGKNSSDSSDTEHSSYSGGDPSVLQMIMVKEVKAGIEVSIFSSTNILVLCPSYLIFFSIFLISGFNEYIHFIDFEFNQCALSCFN